MIITKKLVADVIFTLGNIGGSLLIAVNMGFNFYGYLLFLIGNAAGVYLLIGSNASKSILFITLYFSVVNVIGLIRA